MDTDTLQFTLGGIEYKVRRLTLRQSRALGIGVLREASSSPADMFASSIDQSIDVICAALSRDYPSVTKEALLDTEINVREARAAADSILKFSGFIAKEGESPSGESQPAAA